MSAQNTGAALVAPSTAANVGTVCDCGQAGCPDFAVHDRERRASESTWMRDARRPAFPALADRTAA